MVILTSELKGQGSADTSAGRLDQIETERLEKAKQIPPNPPATSEKISPLHRFLDFAPLSFEVGGLGPGAGPAVNAEFRQPAYHDRLVLNIWGHYAYQNFYNVGTGAELKNVAPYDLRFLLDGMYSDEPQLEYYGPGPNSSIHNRTNFRRESTVFNFGVRAHTSRHINEACSLEQLLLHIGPGTNDDLATTQSVFGPADAPGIDAQDNFYFIAGCSGQLDLRDFPGDPHKGTYAQISLNRYNAENYSRFSFYRLSLAGEQYIPFLNRKRVIALRGNAELSFHDEGQVVPFYLQPTLGSDTELRGFRRYRFYDENSISASAEYRWEISTGFDMAIFVDGGDVCHRPWQCFSQMKSSAGFGLRFKNQSERRVLARLDVGFSNEGFQVWLKIPKVF